MDIIHNILEDPEYLALDSQRQLSVLITIHEILEYHYKRLHAVEEKNNIKLKLFFLIKKIIKKLQIKLVYYTYLNILTLIISITSPIFDCPY